MSIVIKLCYPYVELSCGNLHLSTEWKCFSNDFSFTRPKMTLESINSPSIATCFAMRLPWCITATDQGIKCDRRAGADEE